MEPRALPSRTNPNPEFVKLLMSFISGIRATQHIDTTPSKPKEAQRARRDLYATSCN